LKLDTTSGSSPPLYLTPGKNCLTVRLSSYPAIDSPQKERSYWTIARSKA